MILIVDDEKENRESLSALLKRDQWECDTAANGNEALEKLRENRKIQLLITDLKMPGGLDGIELMELTREIRPEVQRLLVTAFGTVESTVQAMKMGAFDVLTKPLKGKELREKVKEIVQRTVSSENSSSNDISESYNQTLQDIRKAALSEATVLFRGESGIGKSFLAKTLHNLSRRAEKPFHLSLIHI